MVSINGIPVGAGCRLAKSGLHPKINEVIGMLKQHSPLELQFARANTTQTSTAKRMLSSSPLSLDIESAYTFNVAAPDFSQLGCKFAVGYNGTDIIVKGITGVDGIFQRTMKAADLPFIGCVLESLDGEVVPSYANSQLIVNAMSRRWAANGKVEITFCNEKHRDSVRKLVER